MVHYMKCPRCELNYIDGEKQEYCDVCLREMKGLTSDIDEIEEAEAELPTELCPICGENMMRAGEKMCDECKKKAEYEEEDPDPDADDDEWREYLDDDTDDLDEEMGELDEEMDGEFDEPEEEEEEEYQSEDDEDMEYVTGDEIYSLADDDDDEDDGEDDDF